MNKKLKIIISSLVLVIFGLTLSSFNDNLYYQINKAFDTYGAIFRFISSNYVSDVSPEDLLKFSMDGIFEKLDPYSDYYEESKKEDITMLSTGNYVGFGITVASYDGQITITDMAEGYAAQTGGLRIGDRIYKIDDSVVINYETAALKPFTSGLAGSRAKVAVIREGISDTLEYTITRQDVKLKNISYSGMLNDSIAIIMLSRFSMNTAKDVSNTISDLSSKHNLKGLIIDLRDNPGGLLEEAIRLSELFLQKGKLILSTKGKSSSNETKYYATNPPKFPDLPLTVLINENSASASEVVAGALQDYDRAVILGKQSFGKGLVQSVFDLPYNGTLKITTARYFIPSGRSIQRLEYNGVKKNQQLTKMFYTQNGRVVYEQNGISPDKDVENRNLSDYTKSLIMSQIFFDFANMETGKMSQIPETFLLTDSIYNKFKTFISSNSSKIKSKDLELLASIEKNAKTKKYSDNTQANITLLENSLKQDDKKQFDVNIAEIKEYLQYEFDRRILKDVELYKNSTVKDNTILEAVSILKSRDNYNKFLAITKDNQENQKH